MARQMAFGIIVGNRGFSRVTWQQPVARRSSRLWSGKVTRQSWLLRNRHAFGAVESYNEAKICAELFQRHAHEIDGIIVTLPNFGEERGIADAIRLANLQVPILIQATPDDAGKMSIAFRRDSFCGKMSIWQQSPPVWHSIHADNPSTEALIRTQFLSGPSGICGHLPYRSWIPAISG